MERETTRLGHLVERVLRFSRTGRASPDPRAPVDVRAELEQLVAEFAPLAAARGAHVSADLDAVPRVALQPDALRQIVLNLLDNAVKYGPRGQTVRLRLGVRGSGGPGLRVACGSRSRTKGREFRQRRERIWRPYQRGSDVGGVAGSGMGLSVVHEVVTLNGGRAWVEDVPAGAGARFVVALPACEMMIESPPESRASEAEAAPAHQRTSASAHQ